jgi:hypothetical protein
VSIFRAKHWRASREPTAANARMSLAGNIDRMTKTISFGRSDRYRIFNEEVELAAR